MIFDIIVLYKDFTIIITLIFILVILIRYRKYFKNKDHIKAREKTIAYCLNDKIDYSLILNERNNINQITFTDKSIHEIFMNFEKISKAVKLKAFDEEIIKEYYGKYFFYYYEYFLLELKGSTLGKKDDFNFLFIEYEKLLKKWSNEPNYNGRRIK